MDYGNNARGTRGIIFKLKKPLTRESPESWPKVPFEIEIYARVPDDRVILFCAGGTHNQQLAPSSHVTWDASLGAV
jgi:hypothetical protein